MILLIRMGTPFYIRRGPSFIRVGTFPNTITVISRKTETLSGITALPFSLDQHDYYILMERDDRHV